jgi:hypothetical protein
VPPAAFLAEGQTQKGWLAWMVGAGKARVAQEPLLPVHTGERQVRLGLAKQIVDHAAPALLQALQTVATEAHDGNSLAEVLGCSAQEFALAAYDTLVRQGYFTKQQSMIADNPHLTAAVLRERIRHFAQPLDLSEQRLGALFVKGASSPAGREPAATALDEVREIAARSHALAGGDRAQAERAVRHAAVHLSGDDRARLLAYYRSEEGVRYSEALSYNVAARARVIRGVGTQFALVREALRLRWSGVSDERGAQLQQLRAEIGRLGEDGVTVQEKSEAPWRPRRTPRKSAAPGSDAE